MFKRIILIFEKAYSPAFNMAMTVAAARIYGAETLGDLALVFAFSALGQYLTSRGTDQNAQVLYASSQCEQRRLAAASEIKRRLKRLLVSVLGLFFVYAAFPFQLEKPETLSFGLLGVCLGATTACAIPNEIRLIVDQNFSALVALKYVGGCLSILIGFVFHHYFKSGVTVLIGVLVVERLIYLILTIVTSKVFRLASGRSFEISGVPRFNIPVLISAVAIFGYNRLDQVYIYEVFSSRELGGYFATAKLFEVANLLIMAAIASKLHIMADTRRDASVVVAIERELLAFGAGLVGIIAITAPLILRFIFHIELKNYMYIYILALGTLFGIIGAIKGPWVAKSNRFKFNSYFTIAGSVVAIANLFIANPKSLAMVAVSMAFGQLVVNIICPLILKEERDYLLSLVAWNNK